MTLSTGFVSNQTRAPGTVPVTDQTGYRDANDGWIANGRPANFFATRTDDAVQRFMGSVATDYRVSDWLTTRGTVGADLSTDAFRFDRRNCS